MDRGSSGVVTLVACWLECICTGVVALGVVAVRYRWGVVALGVLAGKETEINRAHKNPQHKNPFVETYPENNNMR